jgi:hypothetical protein
MTVSWCCYDAVLAGIALDAIFALCRHKARIGADRLHQPESPLGDVIAHKGAGREQGGQVHQDLTRPAGDTNSAQTLPVKRCGYRQPVPVRVQIAVCS